jgi:beta-1,4-mannosyl-glycoprotein beta-1,4-N-acetylglucosaminyltransferase
LRIDTNGLYFDQILISSSDDTIFGTLIEVSSDSNSLPFWSSQIKDKSNIHFFDLGELALTNFPVQIVDSFSYNGEPVALFHVQYLYPVINEFIIVESWITHSGLRKPFLFFQQPHIASQFAPYMDKITYLIVDEVPPRPQDYLMSFVPDDRDHDAFWRENYQRIIGQQYLQDRAADPSSPISLDKTIVMCVDSDEIFNRNMLSTFRDLRLFPSSAEVASSSSSSPLFSNHQKFKFRLELFYYNFNWSSGTPWDLAFLTDLQSYLLIKDFLGARVTIEPKDYFVMSSGWHLSYFTSIDDIIRKIESMAHREYDLEEFKLREEVKRQVKEGKDLYRRDDLKLLPFDFESNEMQLPEGWEALQRVLLRLQD